LVALLLGAGTPGPALGGADRPLLGLVENQESATLVRVDPRTLLPLRARALRLGPVGSWSYSPDRSRLVVATARRHRGRWVSTLQFLDALRLRPTSEFVVGRDAVAALVWLRSDRLLAVRQAPRTNAFSVVVLDPVAGRVLKTEPIAGEIVRLVPTATQLVALVAPRDAIAWPRLLLLDANGVARSQMLEGIRAGAQRGEAERYERPGLAVDEQRAFVVSAGGPVAEVDLGTLAVTYHGLAQRNLSAAAKASEGWSRRALFLGEGLLAVSGQDEEVWTTEEGMKNLRDRPAGLSLVDTRTWNVRTVDRDANSFVRADRVLYVTRHSWDSSTQKVTAMGVAAYGLDGVKRFHIVPQAVVYALLVYRGQAYIGLNPRGGPYLVVDAASGRVVGRRSARLPQLLREQASPFWGNGY
jgi:hypothetical protein